MYVFGGHLVDARRERVVLHSLAGLQGFSATSAGMKGQVERIRIVFTLANGATQALIVHGKAAAERGIARLRDLDMAFHAGSVAGNVQAQRNIDPFFGMTIPEVTGTGQRLLSSVRVPSVARALLAAVLGLALSLPTWWIRNQRSDDAQFAETTRLGTEAALKAYLLHPLNHKAEVEAALPRAAFVAAKKVGTVTALRKVLQQYPGKGIDEDVRKEINAIYAAAFDRFKANVQRNDEALVGAVRAALGRAESSGHPGVDLVFVRPSAVDIASPDNRLKGLAWSTTGVAEASSHFQGNTASARERRITSELVSAFKSVFPQDVLTPQPVERALGQRPSITIGYSIKPSGATYTSKQTGRMFVGVLIGFTSELRGADASAPWRFKLDVFPPDTFSVSGKSPDDGMVYGEMANRAFDQLSSKLVNAFFGSK